MSTYFDEFFQNNGRKAQCRQQPANKQPRPELKQNSAANVPAGKPVIYQAQRLAYPFALAAIFFFGLQALVSNAGAIDTVFPDIPSPIPFTAGRSFHVNISIYWPLVGLTGGIYYLFCREAQQEIYSTRLMLANFWLMTVTLLAILGTLLLGYNEGREFLEAVKPLKAAMVFSFIMLLYNLVQTYRLRRINGTRATLIGMLAGIFSLIIFYLPNLLNFVQPTVDELVKFWVVHLWEEMSMELIGVGVQTALLLAITGADRRVLEGLLYLDLTLIVLAGILGIGHHYYWIGVPAIWLWIGGVFSAIQVIPAVLLMVSSLKTADKAMFKQMDQREKLTLALVACSVFYHIFGAGLLGLAMAYPALNRYVHGTYITSAHSHLALFGVFGFLTLAVCFYLLLSEINFSRADYRRCWLAIAALNIGMLTMGAMLLVAGILQTYFARVIGLTTTEVNELIRPYLLLRVAGGLSYAAGGLLFTWVVVKNAWQHRQLLFLFNNAIAEQRVILQQVNGEYRQLITELNKAKKLLADLQTANRRSLARLKSIIDNSRKKV